MTRLTLHVQMLGGLGLRLGDHAIGSLPSQSSSSLLAYLILNRDREHTRDVLAGRFWSDATEERARRRLSNSLWQIRQSTRELGVELLTTTANAVGFNPAIEVVLDVEILDQRLDELDRESLSGSDMARVAELSAVVAGNTGELLSGYHDEWIHEERERIRRRNRAALSQLVVLTTSQGEYEVALRHALSLVAEEPFNEKMQQQVLQLYALSGQPSGAQRHYQQLVQELRDELGVSPTAETDALMARITEEAAAGAFAESEQGLDVRVRDEHGQRVRVAIEVGPNATFDELSQGLADLGALSRVASVWTQVEQDLGEPSPVADDEAVRLVAPSQIGLGDDQPVIEWFEYRNPIEFIAAGSATFIALLKFVVDWSRQKDEARVAALSAEADAARAYAEARKIGAEADKVELENQVYYELQEFLERSGFRASTEIVAHLLSDHDAVEAMARLAELKMTVESIDE